MLFNKLETPYKPSQGLRVFSKVPIVTFEPANSEAKGNNHTASGSVFKVKRMIEIVVRLLFANLFKNSERDNIEVHFAT